MKFNKINIGDIIKEKVIEKKIQDAEFGRLINIKRQNLKKSIYEKESLDTNLLIKICEVLEFDFFQYYRTAIPECNEKDYEQEIKATLSIEVGSEKKEKVVRFKFGNND